MKKYVITGSVGHISKPVIKGLVAAGKEVSVITSNADKVKEIEALGAKAITGSVQHRDFVLKAFQGADVVYTMIPPIWQTPNWRASQLEVAEIYTNAINVNNIKRVVNLSSIGAHLPNGNGPVSALHEFEKQLNSISGLDVKHLRPSFFYYNLLNQIDMIKGAGIMGANYGAGDQKVALVHTNDIAAVALEELLSSSFKGNSVRYIVSDERTGEEIATVLGNTIGKKLPWILFTDNDLLKGLLDAGVPPTHAPSYVEMGAALRNGKMQADFERNRVPLAKTKLEDFAKEFEKAYQG